MKEKRTAYKNVRMYIHNLKTEKWCAMPHDHTSERGPYETPARGGTKVTDPRSALGNWAGGGIVCVRLKTYGLKFPGGGQGGLVQQTVHHLHKELDRVWGSPPFGQPEKKEALAHRCLDSGGGTVKNSG